MTELKDFDFAPTKALLSWAFRVCREGAQGTDYQSVGGINKKRSSDEKALVLQEAGRVVNIVDKKLPEVQRALIRFCFARKDDSDRDQNQNYNILHNWVWRQLTLVPGEGLEVANDLSALRVMVPHEVRLRIYGMKRAFSLQYLADFLGVSKTSFQRDCKSGWYRMVDLLGDEGAAAFASVDEYLQGILARRDSHDRDSMVVAEIARYMREENAREALEDMWARVAAG